MTKGSGSSASRSSGASRSGSRTPAVISSSRSSNSRMWSQPATAKQIAALKANCNFDGKYYSKGRAGQTIGQSVRNAGSTSVSLTRSVSNQVHPLYDEVLDHLTRQQHASSLATTASTPEAPHEVAPATTPDQIIVLEEGTTMSQLVPVRSTAPAPSITSVVNLASSTMPDATPFAYVPELVTTLLNPLVATMDPSQVRALEKALTIAKGTLAKELTRARNTLVGILRDAPSGVFASPEAAAEEILWNACSADLEQQLMGVTQSRKGRTQPSKVIDELLAQVRHRVELAVIEAQNMVEIAKIQAALPPAPKRGYEPCWGEVTGVKPFGAFVLLPLRRVRPLARLRDAPTQQRALRRGCNVRGQRRPVGVRPRHGQEREGPAQLRPRERGLSMITLWPRAALGTFMIATVAPAPIRGAARVVPPSMPRVQEVMTSSTPTARRRWARRRVVANEVKP